MSRCVRIDADAGGVYEVGPRSMSGHTLECYGLEVFQGCPEEGTWSELGGVTMDVNCWES